MTFDHNDELQSFTSKVFLNGGTSTHVVYFRISLKQRQDNFGTMWHFGLFNREPPVTLRGAQSYLFNFFFKLLEILVSHETSYFSHNPWQILWLKVSCLEDISGKPYTVI